MEKENISFELILHAGNALSSAMEAMYAARECRYTDAEELMVKAQKELNEAHRIQSDLLFKMANSESIEVDVLLVHAQDHLSMAMTTLNFAEEFIFLRKELSEKKQFQ